MTDDGTADLAGFLLARVAEDEAVARAAFRRVGDRDVGGWYWSGAGDAVFLDHTPDPVACGPWRQPMHRPTADHLVRWDPERVVAGCAATRRVVELAVARADAATLRLLATAWADHPRYREAWRPA